MKEKFIVILLFLFILVFVGLGVYKTRESKRMLKVLTVMEPQHVHIFTLYPRLIGTPVTFNAPDPVITDFFHSLSDLDSYNPPGRDTIASQDHQWFLEVASGDEIIQVSFYIPSQIGGIFGYRKGGDLVVGELLKADSHSPYYGRFQSRKLFQWYQTYNHRWLTPAAEEHEE